MAPREQTPTVGSVELGGAGAWSGSSLWRVFVRVGSLALFVAVPAILFISALLVAISGDGDWAFDFRQFWQGSRDVASGDSPYPSAALLATSSDALGPQGIQDVFRFPYPAATAVLLLPLGVLPFDLAAAILTVLLTLCVPVALWLFGVRDWRVHGLVFATITVGGAVRLGTLTPLLLLGLAVAWRYRDHRWIAPVALVLTIVAKLFLWPMAVWLAATGRLRAAAVTVIGVVGALLAGWAVIGFAGFTRYPELVDRLTDVVGDRGYSLVALGSALGLDDGASLLLPFVLGLPLLALGWIMGRRGEDVAAFSLCVAASIVLTPIVWLHYFTLLLAPLAIARPRLSPAWLLMLLFWVTPFQENEGAGWRVVFALVLLAASTALIAWRPTVRSAHA